MMLLLMGTTVVVSVVLLDVAVVVRSLRVKA